MINRKSIVNSPDDRLRQFNRMPIPSIHPKNIGIKCLVHIAQPLYKCCTEIDSMSLL